MILAKGPAGQRTSRGAWTPALALALFALVLAACSQARPSGVIQARAPGETRPNVLVIQVDHLGPEIGAYGDPAAVTPNIDRLAREGVVFTNAYAASGSEDAETVALLTGAHPSTIGMVQEWSGDPDWPVAPPPEVRTYPELMRAAGYRTFHIGVRPDPFGEPASLWDEDVTAPGAAWTAGPVGQPFLGVVDLTVEPADAGPRKRGFWETLQFWKRDKDAKAVSPVDPGKIVVPAYLPDTPAVRAGLKAEYDRVSRLDARVGLLLQRLEKARALDHTIIVFTAKSGPVRPRAERTVYDSGAHVPLIVRWPDGRGRGTVRKDLVSGVDLAPSILALGKQQPRVWMQGRERFADTAPSPFVFTVQNRVDHAYERTFAVRDGRWLYVLNLAYDTAPSALFRPGPLTEAVTKARTSGGLTPYQAGLFVAERPEAEFYDLRSDPFQLRNLAGNPAYAADTARLAEALNRFAGAAPDYSIWSAQELGDLFKPGGQTPMAMQPTSAIQAGRLVLTSITPGASILWRTDEKSPWRLYTAPLPVPKTPVEAKAVRYGFQDSPTAKVKP